MLTICLRVMNNGKMFIMEVERSGMVTEEQLAIIAFRNAEKLPKIRGQQ